MTMCLFNQTPPYCLYTLPLHGYIVPWGGELKKESDIYNILNHKCKNKELLFCRLENKMQAGIPDINISAKSFYWWIEAKFKAGKLQRAESDFKWQPGQVHFLHECYKLQIPYCLLVGQKNNLVFFSFEYQMDNLLKLIKKLSF